MTRTPETVKQPDPAIQPAPPPVETGNLPTPPASAFTHVEQKAQVSCSVDGQRLDPIFPAQNEGESSAAYTERRSAFLAAYDEDPDMRCTVTRVIIWPNGQVQREAKQLSARCKYKDVRRLQQDSDAAAREAGF